mmetsp:Transcript_46734/g.138050  ORF Transcript_46734/g.138050 Transcript_46734/m.138050 type:complete len:208 (+) Transcript_46734:1052-1675(+)
MHPEHLLDDGHVRRAQLHAPAAQLLDCGRAVDGQAEEPAADPREHLQLLGAQLVNARRQTSGQCVHEGPAAGRRGEALQEVHQRGGLEGAVAGADLVGDGREEDLHPRRLDQREGAHRVGERLDGELVQVTDRPPDHDRKELVDLTGQVSLSGHRREVALVVREGHRALQRLAHVSAPEGLGHRQRRRGGLLGFEGLHLLHAAGEQG